MRIEADYSGRGTTRSVLKWIAVGVVYTKLCLRSFFLRGRSCCQTFFWYFALLMAAGWMTEETRALVSVPLPITKAGLAHSRFSSIRITIANVEAGWCTFNTHWPAVNAHRAQCALKRIRCRPLKRIRCRQAFKEVSVNTCVAYHKRRNFSRGLIFAGKQHPQKYTRKIY